MKLLYSRLNGSTIFLFLETFQGNFPTICVRFEISEERRLLAQMRQKIKKQDDLLINRPLFSTAAFIEVKKRNDVFQTHSVSSIKRV